MPDINLTDPIFSDEEKAREHLEAQRWPDGVSCPFCGGEYGGEGYVPKDERYDRYIKHQAEMIAAFKRGVETGSDT